jgi:CRP-like cAMP-binding protein
MKRKRRKAVFGPKAFLAKAHGGRTISKYQKDQIVFSQGEAADAVFYIQQGKIKITAVSEQGKEAVVAILGAGDFFGEGCLAGQSLRPIVTHATKAAMRAHWAIVLIFVGMEVVSGIAARTTQPGQPSANNPGSRSSTTVFSGRRNPPTVWRRSPPGPVHTLPGTLPCRLPGPALTSASANHLV